MSEPPGAEPSRPTSSANYAGRVWTGTSRRLIWRELSECPRPSTAGSSAGSPEGSPSARHRCSSLLSGWTLRPRAYASGEPLRDAAHAALIERLRALAHPSLRVLAEVPFPTPGDRRAWDVVIAGAAWRHGYEAETRPRDRQALERRVALKARDGDVDAVSLVLLDSRHNRAFVRAHAGVPQARFPVPPRRALESLRAGDDPGGGSVILL
jgi:hypothetical protein